MNAANAASSPREFSESSGNPHISSKQKLQRLMRDAFPGRSDQIKQLISLLASPYGFFPPLLIHGAPSTGKTGVVKQLFTLLDRPYVYASCRSCHTARILFESILNTLVGHVRTADNNYSSAFKCERAADFVQLLPNACKQALAKNGTEENSGSDKLMSMFGNVEWFKTQTRVVYLVIDNIELIRSWPAGPNLLSVLFRLPELTRMPHLGIILISTVAPQAYMSGTGFREPISLYFRDYNDDELLQILLNTHQKSDLYFSFLNAVLRPFTRTTRRLTELTGVLEPLFEKYCEPVISGHVSADEQGKRKLFTLIKPHVKTFLARSSYILTAGDSPVKSKADSSPYYTKNTRDEQIVDEQVSSELELPLCSKYLLLSAYIASTNPATLDATLFDAGGGSDSRKRKKRSSMSTMEKKNKELHERQLKGPGSFSLERLLAIFQCIATTQDLFGNKQNANERGIEVNSEVFMQIFTLVGVNLISQGLADMVEGSPKLRCNVEEEVIHKIAKSIGFPLTKYLYYNC